MNRFFRFFGILFAALILTSPVAMAAVPLLRHLALAVRSNPANHPAMAQAAVCEMMGEPSPVQIASKPSFSTVIQCERAVNRSARKVFSWKLQARS